MANMKDAAGYRSFYTDVSMNATIAAATGDTTLISIGSRTSWTIFVQRIIVYITTDAAQSWVFEDDNGTPKKVAEVTTSPGDETRWDFDFGPIGKPLTEGKDLELNVSAAGLAGTIEVYAYRKLTSPIAASAGAALQ